MRLVCSLPYRTILAFVVMLVTAGCAAPVAPAPGGSAPAPSAPERRAEKRIVYATPSEIDIRPNAAIGSRQNVLPFIASGLTTTDGQGNRRPLLTAEIPSLENGAWRVNPDGTMVTTYTLRPGALWHDGTAITASDFVFSIEVGKDRGVPAFNNVAYGSISDVTASDPRTLVINWKEPYVAADALFSWDQGFGTPLPRHLLQDAYVTNKEGLLDLPYWTQDYVGTGPFKVTSWDPGVGMQLVAHEGYALGRPKIDAIEIKFIGDANALIASLLAGAADATSQLGSIDAAIQLRQQWQAGKVLINLGGGTWTEMVPQFIDPNPAAIADLRVRTALAIAIDRQAITEVIAGGFSPVPHAPLLPNQAKYASIEAGLQHFDYDPTRASQILAEAGYTKGPDGMLRDSTGTPLAIEVRSSAPGAEHQARAAAAVADDWQRIGVAATPLRVPIQRQNDREYVATFPGFYIKNSTIDAEGLRGVTTAFTPIASNNFAAPTPPNASRYMSPELDDLVSSYYRTIPLAERTQIMSRIVHIVMDQVTMIGLYYNANPGAASNRLIGAGPQWPSSSSFGWNSYEWDVQG